MRPRTALPKWLVGAYCAALLVVPVTGTAQAAYDSPTGRVEVLGLRRWTLAMLRDSIRRYVPGQELHDAACMVTLRDSLHFVDASVTSFGNAAPGAPPRSFLSIKLVEPEQAASVQWDVRRRDEFSSLLPAYAPLILPVTDSAGDVWSGRILQWLQYSDSGRRARAMARAKAPERADAERVFGFLRERRTEADRVRAMRVLARDGFWANRMAAVIVLSGFAAHDSTWWAVVGALRDPNKGVRQAAGIALGTLPSREVDWRPAAADLRLLVGGTNLSAMTGVFDALSRTSVTPALAPALLRGNGDWLLDHLGSEAPGAGETAHRLLVRLNTGRDLGRTRSAWDRWVRTL
jgi:hypothetical protein